MSRPHTATEHTNGAGIYAIRVQGHLDARWAARFEGMRLTHEANGETCLTGLVVDQAALYGLLRKVRDLGLTLTSVNNVESGSRKPPHERT